jgi:hypothetical protein
MSWTFQRAGSTGPGMIDAENVPTVDHPDVAGPHQSALPVLRSSVLAALSPPRLVARPGDQGACLPKKSIATGVAGACFEDDGAEQRRSFLVAVDLVDREIAH